MSKGLISFSIILGLVNLGFTQVYVNIPTATDIYNINYYIENDDLITFEVNAATFGYIGFGFTNISGMVSSDIFVGGIDNDGNVYSGDYTGITTGAPRLDEIQNWNLIQAFETTSGTFVKFSRLLSTGDLADIIIEDKLMNIIWSMGTRDELTYHGFTRSTLTFNLISQTNGGIDPNPPPTMEPPSTSQQPDTTISTTTEMLPDTTGSGSFINIPTAADIYQLSYLLEGDLITFEVIAETKGYIGFGFTNTSGMVASDIFIGGIGDDGNPYSGDYTGFTTGSPYLDAEQNWNLIDVFETDTATHIKFSRLIATGDLEDIVIGDNLMTIIWSMGTRDTLSYHGFTRSSLSFNLLAGTNEGVDPNPPPTPPAVMVTPAVKYNKI